MQKKLIVKLLAMGLLMLLLMVPLFMISKVISERQSLRERVIEDISQSRAGAQTLTGPILVLPYKERILVRDEKTKRVSETWDEHTLVFPPAQLKVSGRTDTERLARGIYAVPVYTAAINVEGQFTLPERLTLPKDVDLKDVQWEDAYVSVGVSDSRGIKSSPVLAWGGSHFAFNPGSRLKSLSNGLNANVGIMPIGGGVFKFNFPLQLAGMQTFNIIPLGRDTQLSLRSAWPDPSFIGQYLPDRRTVNSKGFVADWHTSWFATNAAEKLTPCLTEGQCEALNGLAFGVRMMEAVDVYQQTERSSKYDFLFVFLTFGAFFLFEIIRRLAIHPVQYGLVGVALALFFLLLVSLSEKVGFKWAYLIAASACVTLIAYYISHILGGIKRGLGFGAFLSLMYGMLYVLIQSEDYALLLGSALLFGLLTLAMIATRKINWYKLNDEQDLAV